MAEIESEHIFIYRRTGLLNVRSEHIAQSFLKEVRCGMISGGAVTFLNIHLAGYFVSVTENLIEDLYVLPEYQGRGYGTQLLRFAMAACTGRPSLWVLESNAGARRLYYGVRALVG